MFYSKLLLIHQLLILLIDICTLVPFEGHLWKKLRQSRVCNIDSLSNFYFHLSSLSSLVSMIRGLHAVGRVVQFIKNRQLGFVVLAKPSSGKIIH